MDGKNMDGDMNGNGYDDPLSQMVADYEYARMAERLKTKMDEAIENCRALRRAYPEWDDVAVCPVCGADTEAKYVIAKEVGMEGNTDLTLPLARFDVTCRGCGAFLLTVPSLDCGDPDGHRARTGTMLSKIFEEAGKSKGAGAGYYGECVFRSPVKEILPRAKVEEEAKS